jgi:hypothetical protein
MKQVEVARLLWTRRTLNDSELKREKKTGGARRAPGGCLGLFVEN